MQRLKWLVLVVIAVGSMAFVSPAAASHSPYHPDCSDGIDNDLDGVADFPADTGCDSATDEDETNPDPIPTDNGKCNSGRGNGSEIVNAVECDPGNSGGKNKGGDGL